LFFFCSVIWFSSSVIFPTFRHSGAILVCNQSQQKTSLVVWSCWGTEACSVTSRNCKKEICPSKSNVPRVRRVITRRKGSLSRLKTIFNYMLYDIEVMSLVVNDQDAKGDDRNLLQGIKASVKRYWGNPPKLLTTLAGKESEIRSNYLLNASLGYFNFKKFIPV
jgi:hypothetical protein